jgi:hypothetical protein
MAQMTFQLDKNSEKAIDELREFFGTKSNAAAIRSALALARTIVPTANNTGTVVLRDQRSGDDVKIIVAR